MTTTPDSPLVTNFTASPNHDARIGNDLDILVLHYTGMESGAAALQRLRDVEAKVSSHYLVHEDGSVVQLVEEARRARHAGVSYWRGATDINSRSIGIEIVNGGHDFGSPEFPAVQIDAVIALCRDILTRWPIPARNISAHSDVAPSRKRDPGERFAWRRLSDAGIGLWVAPAPINDYAAMGFAYSGSNVVTVQKLLSDFGYVVGNGGSLDPVTRDSVVAFQRHFRPERVDGLIDGSTLATLRRVVDAAHAEFSA